MKTSNYKIPYNLQTFAENPNDESKETLNNNLMDKPKDDPKTTPKETPDDGIDVQKMMTDYAKLKRAFDKTSSELADVKKSLREKMSEQEIASAEKAEQDAKREEEFEFYKRKDKIHEAEKAYLKHGYTPDEAERIAVAETDGDFDAKMQIMSEVEERKKKELEAEFIKNLPDINAGSGNGIITKEQFDQMDVIERSKLRKDDPDTYNRLLGIK